MMRLKKVKETEESLSILLAKAVLLLLPSPEIKLIFFFLKELSRTPELGDT